MYSEVPCNRREALSLLGAASASVALSSLRTAEAAEPKRTRLGIVIYALNIRRAMGKAANPPHDLFDPLAFLDYCRQLGAGGIQIPLGALAPEASERLRSAAEGDGMFIEGIANPPFDDAGLERFEAEMRTAARAGAGVVRTVILPGRRYEQFTSRADFDASVERGRRALERARPILEKHQVRLAVENHKDQRLGERLALLQTLDSPFIGACVDVGNSIALLEDPLAVVEGLAPYALTVHLKDQAVQEFPDGFLLADVALGAGFLHLPQMVDRLRRARPDLHFSLETITRDPLRVPCLAESYWPTFGDVPASDLARTLRLVREHAAKALPVIGSLPREEQVAAELANVRQSLDYAQRELEL